jgi:hypothetical protein
MTVLENSTNSLRTPSGRGSAAIATNYPIVIAPVRMSSSCFLGMGPVRKSMLQEYCLHHLAAVEKCSPPDLSLLDDFGGKPETRSQHCITLNFEHHFVDNLVQRFPMRH